MTTPDTIPVPSPLNQSVTEARTFGDAISRAIGEYREEIARLVAAAQDPQELENYGAEDAWDYLHSVIDGHAWVIYTFLANPTLTRKITDTPAVGLALKFMRMLV